MTPIEGTERVRVRRAREGLLGSSTRLLALALAATLVGCSSSEDVGFPGAPLDCAWFAGENCWKTLVSDARSCVPPADEMGVLSADGSACTYASGADVEFELPVTLPLAGDSPPFYFTQSSSGEECVRFDSRSTNEFSLSVRGMTFVEKSRGFALQVTCPDGTQYASDNGPALFNCTDAVSTMPGHHAFSSDTWLNFVLFTGHGDTLSVFDCAE